MAEGQSIRLIAAQFERAPSTISRDRLSARARDAAQGRLGHQQEARLAAVSPRRLQKEVRKHALSGRASISTALSVYSRNAAIFPSRTVNACAHSHAQL
jgi:hypothetical protein